MKTHVAQKSKHATEHVNDEEVVKIQAHRSYGNDHAALLEALKHGGAAAQVELYDKYADFVRTMLVRVLGMDDELPDLINEVFYQILKSVGSVEHSDRLKGWVAKTTVYVARGVIRKRRRRSWLIFRPSLELYDTAYETDLDHETIEVARAVRQIINVMPVDDQLVFTLRFFHEMEISELADTCGFSLATAKRRLAASERRFKELAQDHPLLRGMLDRAPKWRRR